MSGAHRPRERHSRLVSGRRPTTGVSSPPFGRFLSSFSPWAAVLAVLLSLALANPASAQTSVKLVSNTGQADSTNTNLFSHDFAQAFTTGGNALGCKLTHVEAEVLAGTATAPPTYSAKIFLTTGSGAPLAPWATAWRRCAGAGC